MFVIPCKFSKNSNIIDLVKSIAELQPTEKILVVDSFSDDKSYQNVLYSYNKNIIIAEQNKNYVDSATWFAYNTFPEEEFFYVLHDSMILHKSLEKFKSELFTSIMWFDCVVGESWKKDVQINYTKESLLKTKFKFQDTFVGLFGITFFTHRSILKKLKDGELDKILPTNKNEMTASECIWGMSLEQINVDIKKSSVMGKVGKWRNTFESEYITKYILLRN